jgi:hypothetical protein
MESLVSPKPLHLPNGHRTRSDRIRHVKVHPERSRSLVCVYLAIFEDEGLVYEGFVDLDRVVIANAGEEKPQPLSQGLFELIQLP